MLGVDLRPVGAQQGARPLPRPMQCLSASAVLREAKRENKIWKWENEAESDGQSNSPKKTKRETDTMICFD